MVYGAASAGQRTMTASSSPGFSLKQEGISYCAGAELPCVVVNVVRAARDWATSRRAERLQPDGQGRRPRQLQGLSADANSVQEMCDLTMLAFDWRQVPQPGRDPDRRFRGQMIERSPCGEAVRGTGEELVRARRLRHQANLVTSIHLSADELEAHVLHLKKKYDEIEANEVRYEEYKTEGPR